MTGDLKDADGNALTETSEVWYRNPVECIRELLGNPLFAKMLAYAPERVYRDSQGKVRHLDEMWTADWWWDLQVSIDIMKRVRHLLTHSCHRLEFPRDLQ